jgi:hypothetical protein
MIPSTRDINPEWLPQHHPWRVRAVSLLLVMLETAPAAHAAITNSSFVA